MEFIHLVSHGPWKQVWLAAHVEKKVKPEDVYIADIEKITADVRSRKDVTNLRSTGHLVLGACRIYRRKTEMYESQVTEVRNKIFLAFTKTREESRAVCENMEDLLFDTQDENQDLASSKSHTAKLETTTQPRRHKLASALHFCEEAVRWKNPGMEFDVTALQEELGIQTILDCFSRDPGAGLSTGSTSIPAIVPGIPIYTPDMPLEHDIGDEPDNFPLDDPMGLSPGGQHELDGDLQPIENDAILLKSHPSASPAEEDELEEYEPKYKKRKMVKGALVDDSIEIPPKIYYQYTTDLEPISLKYPRRQDFRLSFEPYKDRFFNDTSMETSLFLENLGNELYISRRSKLLPDRSKDQIAKEEDEIVPPIAPIVAYVPEPAPVKECIVECCPNPPGGGSWSMSAVVTGSMDEEDIDMSRVGFSSRTNKMESLVRQEMRESGVSYKEMCLSQGGSNRHLIAACFFELLVLKTNGVVDVQQNKPYENIMISQGRTWDTPIAYNAPRTPSPQPLVDIPDRGAELFPASPMPITA